ncbi:MAG: hypothetical protein ACYCTB_04320 [bacterium]
MPYILKNNKIDSRYEIKFFEIIRENLNNEKLEELYKLLDKKSNIIKNFINSLNLNNPDFEYILSLVFSVRRHKKKILDTISDKNLISAFNVFKGKKSQEIKVGKFLEILDYDDVIVKRDLAFEILHFLEPENNILWTTWIYKQDNGTGSLPYMADFLKRTWDGNAYIMPFTFREMRDEIDYLYELAYKNGFNIKPPFGVNILLAYMYADYVFKMVYAESKSLSVGVPDGYTLMKKLLGIEKI